MSEHNEMNDAQDVHCGPHEPRIANCPVSKHGWQRVTGRGITKSMLRRTLDWGRVQYTHGLVRVVVGANEVRAAARHGVSLTDCIGIHVVQTWGGEIVSVYRNRSLKRSDSAPSGCGRGRR